MLWFILSLDTCISFCRTANVVLESRIEAINLSTNYNKWATEEMLDAETKFNLIVEHHDNEVLPAEETVFENIVVEHVQQPGAQVGL